MKKFCLMILSFFLCFISQCSANEVVVLPSEQGVVQNIKYIDTIQQDESIQTKQLVKVKIGSGKFKGEIVELENILSGNPYYDIKLKKNSKVILHTEKTEEGYEFSIADIKRSENLIWLALIFCGLLIYVGKKKGLYSLISIGLTILLITDFLSPLILFGVNPVLATMIICILSTAITMFLVGGFNAKSISAILGVVLSIVFAGILSFLTMKFAALTGFTSENTLYLFSSHPELDFISITISIMLLATLGAVMDVAMSISSTINEIYTIDNSKTVKELFKSGMNVGRDIIGTMANTLILVYLGGSLPLILLSENIDWQKFINLNPVVTEIASALIGSIAIVICVPITAIVASELLKKYKKII